MLSQILIVEDNALERKLYHRIFTAEGYNVSEAFDITSALNFIRNRIVHVVILDVHLPDGCGLDFILELKRDYPDIEVIMFTSKGSIRDGVKAIQMGAFDYAVKGESPVNLLQMVQKASEIAYKKFMERSKQEDLSRKIGFGKIIGRSPAIQQAKDMAARVAMTNTNVLLLGDTGVGKDLFAEAIHYSSNRRRNPFVAINCSSFAKEMLESELFGYKAGAFTGAIKDKKGLLEAANHGTVFLDEIGEMNMELQSKILRVIQNRSFIKVGDTQTTTIDCRFIAATNVDLTKAISEGTFREDLYYRISTFIIHIPALVERGNDLELLMKHFVEVLPPQLGLPVPEISPEFIKVLKRHQWRGNVRELINVVQRAIILSDGKLVPELLDIKPGRKKTANRSLEKVEMSHIQEVLLESKGNKSEAARRLGISLATLYRKIGT